MPQTRHRLVDYLRPETPAFDFDRRARLINSIPESRRSAWDFLGAMGRHGVPAANPPVSHKRP